MKTELMNKIEEKEYKMELEIIDKKIEDTYKQIYVYSNPKLIMLYYDIGGYINTHKTWGSEYIKRLSNDLKHRNGMSVSNLKYMAQFAKSFTRDEISQQPVGQIPWGQVIWIMAKCKTKESRLWYIEKTYEYSWSRATLIKQIKAKAYERNQIEPIVSKGVKDYDSSLIEGLVKNSYLLPFTSKDFGNEKDLKDKIINEILNFLKELGKGYALLGKEYEIKTNSSKKFFIDILMYNVILHSYVVIEIKIGDYKPAYYGQLKNYVLLVDEQKNVLAIGGGPSGMEAAYVLKKRGHHVILAEKEDELGGLLRPASIPPAKQDLTRVVKYLKRRLEINNVEVRLNEEITLEKLQNEYKGYEVVLSSGSSPIVLSKFDEFKQTMTADEVLMGKKFPGRKIVILGGGSVGCETADYLAPIVHDKAPRNREIIIIEAMKEVMMKDAGAGRAALVQRMMTKPIDMVTSAMMTRVDKDNIYYEQNGVEHCISDADTLIYAVGYRSNNALASKLEEAGIKVHVTGDAGSVATLREAITTGYEVARKI